MTEPKVCIVGPCQQPQLEDRQFCEKHKNVRIGTARPRQAPVTACPKCGGTALKARRKLSTKVALGVVSLAGRAHHVECVACGHMWKRANV